MEVKMAAEYEIRDQLNIPVEEAYKVLRTNIQFCGFNKDIKTLTITSFAPGEGKTTTAINLAISKAKSGMKVLLIDADLRKPVLLKHISSNNPTGVSNYISGTAPLEEIICATNIENLYVIACGPKPPNPAELVGSSRFAELLDKVKESFDSIIIDTPPLGSVIDGAVIASQTDATLLVIKARSVSSQNVKRIKDQLDKVKANVLGVILNKVSKSDYKNYYSYYDYYGEDKSGNRRKLKKVRDNKKRGKV